MSYLIALCVIYVTVWAIAAADIGTVLATAPIGFWVLAGLAVIVDTPFFTLRRPSPSPMVLASVSFTFAMSYAWGHGTGRSAQTIAILVSAALTRREVWAVVFDVTRYGLALSVEGIVAGLVGRTYPVPENPEHLVYMIFAAVAWYLTFRLVTATGTWLREGGQWTRSLRTDAGGEALSAGALLLLAPMLLAAIQINTWLASLVLVPLYAVSTMSRLWYEQTRQYLVDPLTGLANRTAMERETARLIATDQRERRDGRPGQMGALIVIDLDQFWLINEALGYAMADQVLVGVAQRLAQLTEPSLALARLKGDEFIVLLSGLGSEQQARAAAGKIRAHLHEPITVEGQPMTVDASLGVAIYPVHGDDFHTLTTRADMAMHHAKELPGRVAMFQSHTADSVGSRRWALLSDLRQALDHPVRNEILPLYQPQVDLATGEIIGAEALLRWHHPTHGMVSPDEVVSVAEHSPVMQQITRHMIERTLGQLDRWQSDNFTVRASVNVSVRDLYDEHFVPWLHQQLQRYGIPAASLQLEITERAVMTQPGRVLSCLLSLRELGVDVSLDDFGTGFSSLDHVRRLPLNEVKIDRSFTQSMINDPSAAAVVKAVIDIANDLGLRVVAEGVEDERTRQRLLANGCRIGQGWYYAPALPADEFDQWRERHTPAQPAASQHETEPPTTAR